MGHRSRPLAPFLLESLALSRVQAGLFLPAVYLGGVLMALPAGWFTDRLHPGQNPHVEARAEAVAAAD